MKIIGLFLLCLFSAQAWPAYYDTLPRGVRTLVYHRVQTTKVESAFSANNTESDYFYRFNLDAPTLESASEIFESYLKPLKEQSPEAYNALSLGEYEIDAHAEVNVNAFAFGWGITDNLTSYIVVPYFDAVVNMDFVRTRGNNNQQVQRALDNSPADNTDTVRALVDGVSNSLPDVTGGVIQSVMVNYFEYQPLGTWEGKGLGDIELNNLLKLYDDGKKGAAMMFGVVFPTGRRDDPDILQDFSFGDGQFDTYLEFGGGISFPTINTSFDAWTRYTYQLPSQQTLRVPETEGFSLGTKKLKFNEKLGDIISAGGSTTFDFTDYLSTTATYIFSKRFETDYQSVDPDADLIMERGTDMESHTAVLGVSFSTITLYKKGKFPAPLSLSLSGQKIIAGKNTPDVSRADLQLRLFF